jgi:hypothetical protein
MILVFGRPLRSAASNDSTGRILMIVVRNCFIAKPGHASKLAAQLKEAAASAKIAKYRVMTDLTGDFNRVILEYEADNIGGFEAMMKDYASNSAFREKMKGYTELWSTGSREILQVA